MKINITGTIATLNSTKKIRPCLESLSKVCNQIIIIDSLSSDNIQLIADEYNAEVLKQEYLGEGLQKNLVASKAKNEWILNLDDDEELEEDTIHYIKNLDLENFNKYYSFTFRRRNYVGQKWIKAAGFYPDYVTRLYNKDKVKFCNVNWHAYVPSHNTKKVNIHIKHMTYSSYKNWIEKINIHSSISAKTMHVDGVKRSSLRPITHSLFAFFKKMLLKGGIFQGIDGFTVALTTMFNTYMKYIKLNELYDENIDPDTHFPEKKSDEQ